MVLLSTTRLIDVNILFFWFYESQNPSLSKKKNVKKTNDIPLQKQTKNIISKTCECVKNIVLKTTLTWMMQNSPRISCLFFWNQISEEIWKCFFDVGNDPNPMPSYWSPQLRYENHTGKTQMIALKVHLTWMFLVIKNAVMTKYRMFFSQLKQGMITPFLNYHLCGKNEYILS